MKIDPHSYNITIRKGTFEDEVLFEARVKELPDLAEYGESYAEAYDLAVDTIETAAQAYAEYGQTFPVAQIPVDDYSGRVTLRLPTSLHRSLSHASEDEGISLNQFLVNVLSYYSGFAAAQGVEGRGNWRIIPNDITRKPGKSTREKHLILIRSDNLRSDNLRSDNLVSAQS